MQRFIRIFLFVSVTMAGVSQANHMDDKTIDERTRPVGQVNIEGMPVAPVEEVTAPVATVEEAIVQEEIVDVAVGADVGAAGGRTGESLYNSFCIACHSIGLANAPKAGDAAAWAKVLEVGMDNLVSSAKKGKNVMPPMGTCADCSDDELKNAIEFMRTMNQ